MKRIMKENDEILKNLGSDYDEEGIPYWEKWGKQIDNRAHDAVKSLHDKN
jgi:hypothetical protein